MGSLDTPVSPGQRASFVAESAFSQPGLIVQTMLPNGTVVTSFQGEESILLTAGHMVGRLHNQEVQNSDLTSQIWLIQLFESVKDSKEHSLT